MTVAPPPGPLPPGRRGELATAVAVAVDAVPGVDRSRSLTHSTIYPGAGWTGSVSKKTLSTCTSASLAAEHRQCGRDPVQHASHVDVDHRVPTVDVKVGHRAGPRNPCVTHKDVNALEPLDRRATN